MSSYMNAAALGALALVGGNLLATNPAAAAPVGVTVYAEEWTPSKVNSETLKVIENNPTLLSDAMNQAYASFRSWYLSTIPQILQRQNYLHSVDPSIPSGISLYDRKGNTNLPPEMSLPAQVEFTIKSDAQNNNMLRVNFTLPASSISLCATTPTVLDSSQDPCATLLVDLSLGMGIQISDTPGRLLTITTANITTTNFRAQDPNLTTEIVQGLGAVYAYLGGPNYQATLVKAIDTNRVNVTSQLQKPIDQLNATIGGYEQGALTSINQLLQPAASIDRLVHLALVVQPSGSGQTLAILLAPPTTGVNLNPAAMTGKFSGTLAFDKGVQSLPASCADLDKYPQIQGQVQTGPRQIVSINGASSPVYGSAPMQGLNLAFDGQQGPLPANRSCTYTLNNLALGFPNILNFSAFSFKASGQAQASTHLEIQPSHWSSPVIVGPNGVVISTGTAVASTPATYSRQVQNGGFNRVIAPTAGNTQLATRTQPWNTGTTGNTGNTGNPLAMVNPIAMANPVAMQSGGQMALVVTQGFSYQSGAGAIPQRAHIGVSNPGDPLANRVITQSGAPVAIQATSQSTAPVANQMIGQSAAAPAAGVQAAGIQAVGVQGVTKAPVWGGTTTPWTPAAAAGPSSMRATTAVGTLQSIQSTQQPAATHAAPSSLTGP